MRYKVTWYPLDGSDPTEEMKDTLVEVADAIRDRPEWETEGRGVYVDWVDE